MKFAEAFAFGRENPTGTSDLVISGHQGETKYLITRDNKFVWTFEYHHGENKYW